MSSPAHRVKNSSVKVNTSTKAQKTFHTYYGANCKECPVKLECTGREDRVKVISCNEYEPERQRMALKMETPKAKKNTRNVK